MSELLSLYHELRGSNVYQSLHYHLNSISEDMGIIVPPFERINRGFYVSEDKVDVISYLIQPYKTKSRVTKKDIMTALTQYHEDKFEENRTRLIEEVESFQGTLERLNEKEKRHIVKHRSIAWDLIIFILLGATLMGVLVYFVIYFA